MAQENKVLKTELSRLKEVHIREVKALKEKIEYYEETIKNSCSRAESTIDDISRSNADSKTGESTIESDKLTHILKR